MVKCFRNEGDSLLRYRKVFSKKRFVTWIPTSETCQNQTIPGLKSMSMSIKTSFTELTINFFYLRYLITKPYPLNHLVVYCLTNANGFFSLSRLDIFCTLRSLDTSLLMWF
jgi:hypothetical protein